jgi:hypothetical protein
MKENNKNLSQLAWELLKGGYDLHIHAAPCVFPRGIDCFELVHEANNAQMAGVMLKSHYESTALLAELVNKYSNCKTKAFGGIALNWPVGGLNPYAVENAIKAGASIVWMPTRDAANSLNFGNMSGDFFTRPGISLLNSEDKLKSSIYEIMDIVKEHDKFLATGHISPKESILLCKEGRKRNVRMILTHPEFPRTTIPGYIQKEIADMGVIIEKNWYNVAQKAVSIKQMVANIRMVGSNRTFIATDRGQRGFPNPTVEMHEFIYELLDNGLKTNEITDLVHNVPKSIVG